KLTAAVLTGGALADVKAKANQVIAKARKRAANIGTSQTRLVSRGMDGARREAAGVTSYVWHHSPHVIHPREWHVARDGRTFKDGEIAGSDEAGVPYGCQCWTSPAL
ncbi:hypothetical protein, partial [Companilactobacillus sp.]|uniref:hypothetical protein n=1 Tax=Companilactobacillus sp. TaxID=2767905 RepID=UPI00260C889C